MQECYVFTTLRFDESLSPLEGNETAAASGPVYLLQYHYDRLLEAANAVFGTTGHDILRSAGTKDAEQLLQRVEVAVAEQPTVPSAQPRSFRVRLQIEKNARVSIAITSVPKVAYERLFVRAFDLPVDRTISWTVHLDSQPTSTSIHTQCKTHDRSDYNRARSETGIESFTAEQEVLLFNEAGHIFDASITTPYFFRNGRWTTPSVSYGGQRGTTRRWALAEKLCVEGGVHMDSVQSDEIIWLSNAARGFFRARVRR